MTQRLKLEPSPISQTHVDKLFSPVCECVSQAANIEFTIRKADRLRIAIRVGVHEVTIATGEHRRGLVHARWNGRDATGAVVSDGIYFPVVHMQRAQRTIDLPNPIRVDTQRPSVTVTAVRSNGPKVTVTYAVTEPAHGLLIVDGRRAVYTYSIRRHGRLTWYGRVNGRAVHASRHRLVLVAEDVAGNRSAPVRLRGS